MSRNEDGNIVLEDGFKQVCVWPGTLLEEETIPEFVQFFKDEMDARIQFMEVIITTPDVDSKGAEIPGTGGRSDVFFAIHKDDVMKFAVPRLSLGIRWIEDVFGNGGGALYAERVFKYVTW